MSHKRYGNHTHTHLRNPHNYGTFLATELFSVTVYIHLFFFLLSEAPSLSLPSLHTPPYQRLVASHTRLNVSTLYTMQRVVAAVLQRPYGALESVRWRSYQGPKRNMKGDDGASARLLKERFSYTKGWRNVDPQKALKLKKEVLDALRELKGDGNALGERTATAAISVLTRVDFHETAKQLFLACLKGQKRRTHRPHKFTTGLYNAFLHSQMRSSTPFDTLRQNVLSEMQQARVYPDLFTYNICLKGYARKGDLARCKELFSEMETKQIHPDVVSYNTLLSAASKPEIGQVLALFKESGLSPGASSYLAVFSVMLREKDVNGAQIWLKKAQTEGSDVAEHYRTVIIMLASRSAKGDAEEIDLLLEHLETKGEICLRMRHAQMQAWGNRCDLLKVNKVYQLIDGVHDKTYLTFAIFVDALTNVAKVQSEKVDLCVELGERALVVAVQTQAGHNYRPYLALARLYAVAQRREELQKLRRRYEANPLLPSDRVKEFDSLLAGL